jgi:hypothetical protein
MMALIRTLVASIAALLALVVTLPVVLAGAPFWIVSALTRAVRALVRWWQPPEVDWTQLVEFDPGVGWKNRCNARARVRGKCAFEASTDGEGWRGRGTIEDSDVVAFGDSFAFGHGVNDRDFFADRTARLKIKAVGADGYNMVQGWIWMDRLKERLSGKWVVWLPFYGNDLMDNLQPNITRYRTPFVRSTAGVPGWEVVTHHVTAEPFPFDPSWGFTDTIAETCSSTPFAERAYSACAFLIDRARETLAEVDARLVVVGIPDPQMLDPDGVRRLRSRSTNPGAFDPELPDRRLGEICRERGIPFLPLSSVLVVGDHIPNDCHWTPQGHLKVARALEAFTPVP